MISNNHQKRMGDKSGARQPQKRKKFAIPSSSKNPPAPTTNIRARPTTLSPTPPPPHHFPVAPPPAPGPAPVAAIPPPPPKRAVPAQSLLSPTDVILQYVIKQTKKHPISESDSVRHYRSKIVYTSKKEANETCRRRVLNLLKEDIPFQTVDQRYVGDHLFKGTIFYGDGEVQFYYVHEEAAMLGDVVEKRELWVDEEGMGIYAKRMWAVWAVRYYPSEEEETKMEQVVLGSGVGVGSENGRVEVVDEGNEGDDEDDGEEEEDLFGYTHVEGQLDNGEGVTPTTSEDLAASGSQTNMNDSQTEGHQTQTQTELKLQTQQQITSDGQCQSIQTLSDKQTQPTHQTHQRLEGHSDAQPEPKSQTELVTQPQPDPYAPSEPTQQVQPQPPSQSQPTRPPRPPTPPLPCSLYSPPPPSTIYSSSSESDSEDISHTSRSLPNNIPPPPPPLPSSSLLTPNTTLHGTFTTLRLANLEVLEVFKQLTKPETPARMNDVSYWRDEVVPEAEARFKEWSHQDGQDDDNGVKYTSTNEQGDGGNENDVDDCYGKGIEQRPFNLEWEPDAQLFKWRFRKVEVWVQELELKGPKNLGGLEIKAPLSVAGPSTGNGNSGVSTSEAARPKVKAKGAGTVKVKATATATTIPRTAPKTDDELANQHTYYRNAREVLAAKAQAKKKRRRPTRQEKGKDKAFDADPVVLDEGNGNGKGAGQVNMKEWEDEWGGIEEGDLSEEE